MLLILMIHSELVMNLNEKSLWDFGCFGGVSRCTWNRAVWNASPDNVN